jgi:hypothetical protein
MHYSHEQGREHGLPHCVSRKVPILILLLILILIFFLLLLLLLLVLLPALRRRAGLR